LPKRDTKSNKNRFHLQKPKPRKKLMKPTRSRSNKELKLKSLKLRRKLPKKSKINKLRRKRKLF
tara:strand:+ start:239 stop:430 length:192 start_codon:yes stop_codon:yes gene_type:complete